MTLTRPAGAEMAITFLYYRDLATAARFYESVLGLDLVIDQGWARIYRLTGAAHLGLVDEARGMNKWAERKTVQVCLRVADVDAWRAFVQARSAAGLSDLFVNEQIGIRAFTFRDPEGYQIEIQSPIRPGA